MDRIDKELRKYSQKERAWVKIILEKIRGGNLDGLDVKRLRGKPDVFRIRKANIRIIYRTLENKVFILIIQKRNEGTYRDL